MDKLIVLGSGHAGVTKCYNTCFCLTNEEEYILVDGGGGNGILVNMEKAKIPISRIHHAFVSHHHTDHILGIVWVIRMIAYSILTGKYEGIFRIYCHSDLAETIKVLAKATLDKSITDLIGIRIILIPVEDGEKHAIAGWGFTFFDIHSGKAKQFGFSVLTHEGKKVSFLGDEPYNLACQKYIQSSDWLLCEAFCLFSERDRFKPYEKNHSTVKDACELAAELNIKNLVLWHTEDQNLANRKELYTAEGQEYFKGNIYVPYDLEVIELW